jgi:uncharacterized membrane protein (UPF0136 family)
MTENELLYVFATLMLVGGVFGYIKGKSTPSLIAGVGSAILLAVAGFLMGQGSPAGFYLGLIVAILLGVVFTMRLMKTKSFMPSGLMLLICIAFLILFLLNR